MEMETRRERKRKRERQMRNNVAFVRGSNSGYIKRPTMTRSEYLDEQRAGKEGDERERGNTSGEGSR